MIMKKIFYLFIFCLFVTDTYAFSNKCNSYELYDYYYSDGTCGQEAFVKNKQTIGIIYEISSNKLSFKVLAIEQSIEDWRDAIKYCQEYGIERNRGGNWYLPSVSELINLGMVFNGKHKDKYGVLNNKLDDVYKADQLKYRNYWSSSDNNDGYDDRWVVNFAHRNIDSNLEIYTKKFYARCIMSF